MAKYLLSALLFTTHFAIGQTSDTITKIIIDYGRNHSSWGEPGIYARSEIIEITPTPNGDYKISKYFRVNASAGNDGKTFSKDTIELNVKRLKVIHKDSINFWLTQLNESKDNFSTSFLRPRLTTPTKKQIFQAAKKYDLLWKLKGSDADRADTKKAISQIQSFYKFDSFLIFKKPTIEFDMIVMDSYNGLRITTAKSNDTTEYRCQFYQPLGQPIIRYNHKDYSKSTKVFNLQANVTGQSFLPINSMARQTLDINNLTEFYIKWYLENVMDE